MTGFGALYTKYAQDVYHFALYLSGERGEAEDITSETFVRAWASSETIWVATVRGYLFTIARNLFLQARLRWTRTFTIHKPVPTCKSNRKQNCIEFGICL